MEFASVSREKITAFIDRYIGKRISWLLNETKAKSVLPRDVATPLALHRFEKVAQSAAHPTPLSRLFNVGLEFYRRGWIPGSLVSALSPLYFKRTLATPV
jgi:hypothetical protein